MVTYKIKGDFIQLIQLLKVLNWVENGGEAQAVVSDGLVKYNGVVDCRKRLKIRQGDLVEYGTKQVRIME